MNTTNMEFQMNRPTDTTPVLPEADQPSEEGASGRRPRKRLRWITIGVLVLLVLGGLAAWSRWMAPAIVKAKYKAEVRPSMAVFFIDGCALFSCEYEVQPGLAHRNGAIMTDDHACNFMRKGAVTNGGTTRLDEDSGRVQTFLRTCADAEYSPAILAPVLSERHVPRIKCVGQGHVMEALQKECVDLLGKRMRPFHFQYVSGCGGYGMVDYWIAYGCFGDGDGLPAGTGVARIEILNHAVSTKEIATWRRYRPKDGCREQILFAIGDEYRGEPKAPNRCYIPPTAELMSEDPAVFEAALQKMRECGWDV